MTKKTIAEPAQDELSDEYNAAFEEGLAIGDWVVQMLDIAGQSFIIPVNPYESEKDDPERTRWNGWRDGFDEAIVQLIEIEELSIHEVMREMMARKGMS